MAKQKLKVVRAHGKHITMDEATHEAILMALNHASAGVNVLAILAATGDVDGLAEGSLYCALNTIENQIGEALEKLQESPKRAAEDVPAEAR